ncbi:MAG: hypothetical protein HY567_04100 [Candidatus Kerfeldbacteria bacterium]|nr:hypothetical protein [Candidatus Kerfeldbacteria bacterium]
MNHAVIVRVMAAWSWITQFWTRYPEHPMRDLIDWLDDQKERRLTKLFLGTETGRRIYNQTSADWWTNLRLKTCWIPPVLVVLGWSLVAVPAWLLIWSTDIIDGWFARTKQEATADGERRETTVDTIFKLLMFVAIWIRFNYMRTVVEVASGLEVLRIVGALYMIWNGFKPKPNRSGRTKPFFYAAAIGLLLIFPGAVVGYLMLGGITLSAYSMVMHWIEYQNWRHSHIKPRH